MTFASYLVIALLSILGIATVMEFYKKTIRKGKSATWENWVVGAVLSIGVSVFDCLKGLAYAIFPDLMIVNIIIYAVAFFFIQMFVDMNIIKKIIYCAVDTMDIVKFVYVVLEKLGLSVDKVKEILTKLNITKEKLQKVLEEAGFPEDKIKVILDIFYD